jgi:hypothetical protein
MDFDLDSSEKIASLIASVIAIGGFAFYKWKSDKTETPNINQTNTNSNSQNITLNVGSTQIEEPKNDLANIAAIKSATNILFIDDDKGFKIVGILKKMGWPQTKLVTDVQSIDDPNILSANVLFIDIQGVGRKMQLKDEGLGLALAIKRRYREKKIIIYSAQEEGKRFDEALQEADYSLPKNAEPIRFEETLLRVLNK